ncbi:MAG: hypothetical protein H6741_20955 [Alphaproteobacteria bacterium]|nr:hypothetical protein [Alphaproteobacteria bacterium]
MLLLLLTACTPGRIDSSLGPDELRSAYYTVIEGEDADVMNLLLLNSELPCDITPALEDPALRDEALTQLYVAFTREGARVVYVELHRWFNAESWQGYYPLYDADDVDHLLTATAPFAARGLYMGVNEAAVTEEDGLYREYTPTEVEFGWADEPSELRVSRDGDTIAGQFGFNHLDVSGRFRAEPCESLTYTLSQAELLITELLNAAQED